MKTGSIFWGAFLVVLGGLFLAKNFGVTGELWEGVWKLWPVILISLGVSYLIANDVIGKTLAAVSGVLTGAILWTLFQTGFGAINNFQIGNFKTRTSNSKAIPQTFNAAYTPKITHARLNLNAAAGEFALGDTASAADLIRIESKSSLGGYTYNSDRNDTLETIDVNMKDARVTFGKNSNIENETAIFLNPNPIWHLDVDVSAASMKFDFAPFKVAEVTVQSGASSMDFKFGDKLSKVVIDMDAAAASVVLRIPTGVGCEVDGDIVFSSNALEGFKKSGTSSYRSENFETATKKIYIHFDGGLSSLSVKRY
jgi:hypothetical protein